MIGAISRKGNVVCPMIEQAHSNTYDKFVRETVSNKVSLVATDDSYITATWNNRLSASLGQPRAQEYVRGEVHTQSIDSFWSLLKRQIIRTYHNVSKYLPLYLNEFQWRFNP